MDNKINWQKPPVSYSVSPSSEDDTKIKHALSQANSIKWIGVVSVITIIILFVIFFALIFINTTAAIATFVILFLFNFIMSMIVVVKIAKTDWIDRRLNKSKKTYWVSSLVLAIIFLPLLTPVNWVSWAGMVKRALENRLAIKK